MLSNKKFLILCDLLSSIDVNSGDRRRKVINAKQVVGEKLYVGILTQQLAQSQNTVFQYSIEIGKIYFNEQKYLFMDGQVYEIRNISPAKSLENCKLNVVKIVDEDILKAIKEWVYENICK